MSVTNLDDYRKEPHAVHETICVYCHYSCIGVAPADAQLKDYVCAQCEKTGGIILTGQPLDDSTPPKPKPFT